MEESKRKEQNEKMISDLYKWMQERARGVILTLEKLGYRPRITESWRDPARQKNLYMLGRSHVMWGYHNATSEDGKHEALAFDLVDDNSPLAPGKTFILAVAWAAAENGLDTGAYFGLNRDQRNAIASFLAKAPASLAGPSGLFPKYIGWDALHVEVDRHLCSIPYAMEGGRPQ